MVTIAWNPVGFHLLDTVPKYEEIRIVENEMNERFGL
jgi:hypothetical protein